MANQATRIIIVGAAGRDFHEFNTRWRDNENVRVVAFTAAQIPNIDGRTYPPELCGSGYPNGIPIKPQEALHDLIVSENVDQVYMAYSDLPYAEVMHIASIANAAGADFCTSGARQNMIASRLPVIAVCAVRTGCGKSQVSRAVSKLLKKQGRRVAVIRHPMPYGDLRKQVCQRFASVKDLDLHECTIEEREEYEPHIDAGSIVFAGVDYGAILRQAEQECDVILWDGGNNDIPFYKPDLHIVLADPHRPGHEVAYFPGETNVRMADLVLIAKTDTATPENVLAVRDNIQRVNPGARIIDAASPVTVDDPNLVKGKRVLVVEDGPTLTHGEMTFGAGVVAARNLGAAEMVDPRPFAIGSIRETYDKYPHLTYILPAMGYGKVQMGELEQTINAVDCDLVMIGTPIDLAGLLDIDKPTVRVRYELDAETVGAMEREIESRCTVAG